MTSRTNHMTTADAKAAALVCRQAAVFCQLAGERGQAMIDGLLEAATLIEAALEGPHGMTEAMGRIKRISQREDMSAPAKVACIESIAHSAMQAARPIDQQEARKLEMPECPTCLAKAGQRCRNMVSGGFLGAFHSDRIALVAHLTTPIAPVQDDER